MSARLTPLFPGLALAVLALLPATVNAATINFKVVDSRSVPQAQVIVESTVEGSLPHFVSNGAGEVVVSSLNPGDTVYFTRQLQPSNDPCETAPEGIPGVSYTVPNPAPSSATVTLPALDFKPDEPGLSSRERGLVGLINDERRAHGLDPLVISTVLESASDGYLAYVPAAPSANNSSVHCLLSGVRTRIIDAGYPVGSKPGWIVAENLVWADSATEGFEMWMNSPVHREAILNPNFDSIGLSNQGNKWLADFACTDPGFVNRAGWTGDYGDASLADKSDGAGEADARNPRLSFKTVKVHGHRLRVRVNIVSGAVAEGHLIVLARHGHQKRVLRLAQLEARARLGTGRWTVEARFEHGSKAEYLDTSIACRVRVGGGEHRA